MGGNEVARFPSPFHVTEPGVAGATRRGLGCAGSEPKLAELERQAVPRRQVPHLPRDRIAVRLDLVVGVGDDEHEAVLRGRGVQEIEQGDGIRSARHRHQRGTRAGEQPDPCEVLTEAVGQRGRICHV